MYVTNVFRDCIMLENLSAFYNGNNEMRWWNYGDYIILMISLNILSMYEQ